MTPLQHKVIAALRKRTDDTNEVTCDTTTIATEIDSTASRVHQALVSLIQDSYFVGTPYVDRSGMFVVTLP